MPIDAILVTAGGALSALAVVWFFFASRTEHEAELRGDMQEVTVTVQGGYSPDRIRVRQGVPLRIVFDRREGGECTSRVVFPDFRVNRALPQSGRTAVEFTPDREGEFGFACGMNMVRGTLVVEPATSGWPVTNGHGGAMEPAAVPDAAVAPEHERNGHHPSVVAHERPGDDGTREVEFAIDRASAGCSTCFAKIEAAVERLPGVVRTRAYPVQGRVSAEYDPDRTSVEAMREAARPLGYDIRVRAAHGDSSSEDNEAAARRAEIADLTRRVVTGALLSAPVLYAVMAGDLVSERLVPELLMNHWVQLGLIAPVMFYTGWPIHRPGWLTLIHRSADANTLVTLGTTAAFAYSLFVTVTLGLLPGELQDVYYEAVGVILTLILLGRLTEARAKAGTGEAIRKLVGLQVRTARVLRDGAEQEVPIEEVVPGDLVLVRPGEKVPVDGEVAEGRSTLTSRWSRASRRTPGRRAVRHAARDAGPHQGLADRVQHEASHSSLRWLAAAA